MLRYTAGYVSTNNNFVIQNLDAPIIEDNPYYPWLCVIKNLLQRGSPTKLSAFLQEYFPKKASELPFLPLITSQSPSWGNTIRWDIKNNNNPALKFFDNIPKYFPKEYHHLQQLLIPEVEINDIIQIANNNFQDQRVDFYLPQAFLVIEIDGRNEFWVHWYNDKERDAYLKNFWIETIRIDTKDIYSESETFKKKVREIINRIDHISLTFKDHNPDFISFFDYLNVDYKLQTSVVSLVLTSIIRIQLLLIELLMRGKLTFDQKWEIEIKLNITDKKRFDLAIKDLFLWLKNIYALQDLEFIEPEFNIHFVREFTLNPIAIKIDFSVLKRWDDIPSLKKHIIFVRTDYFDSQKTCDRVFFKRLVDYDYFKLSTTTPVSYIILERNKESLQFFLKNLIGYDDFRPWQFPIIQNILSNRDTIGLLPTGSWKSLCFHLACLLQPTINFVVCPIKSLMVDQEQELKEFWVSRVASITSDHSAEEKEQNMFNFWDKRLFLVFISPERFQTITFRSYLSSLGHLAYAVIDEIHCLSEWGHDFRTSYLCLAKTIRHYCPGIKFLGLTATASANVLKDIQIELNISDKMNIKTLSDFSRPELEFHIIDDGGFKSKKIRELLVSEIKWPSEKKNGIIFTSFVNGTRWCYQIAKELSDHFKTTVWWFSGSVPARQERVNIWNSSTMERRPVMSEKEFTEYKLSVQKQFKSWEIKLLTATKAFWMGVNKRDVYFTIHYGIPGSMESLYQEWGRAWRDKEKLFKEKWSAKCYVLLGQEKETNLLERLFDPGVSILEIKKIIQKIWYCWGDVASNMILWQSGEEDINEAVSRIMHLYRTYMEEQQGIITIRSADLDQTSEAPNTGQEDPNWEDWVEVKNDFWNQTEKYIYRLMLLWIIADYTVQWSTPKTFRVQLMPISDRKIKENLFNYVEKYDSEALVKYEEQFSNITNPLEKYLTILLQWSYDHHSYHRRQSLKNLYENCLNVLWEWKEKIDNAEFKKRLEDYFKMDDKAYAMQDIADSIDQIDKRSMFFFRVNQKWKILTSLIPQYEADELKSMLSRLLESYQNNIGLNLMSGMLRLYLWEFENADGRIRFENALAQIKHKSQSFQQERLVEILSLWKKFHLNQKVLLSKSLLKYFSQNYLMIYESLQDEYSLNMGIHMAINSILSSYTKLHDKLEKIRW